MSSNMLSEDTGITSLSAKTVLVIGCSGLWEPGPAGSGPTPGWDQDGDVWLEPVGNVVAAGGGGGLAVGRRLAGPGGVGGVRDRAGRCGLVAQVETGRRRPRGAGSGRCLR